MHYCDVIMGVIASKITSLTNVYSAVYSRADQRKHQSSASLAFVRGIHRWPVNSPHKWPVTTKNVSIWWHHHELQWLDKPISAAITDVTCRKLSAGLCTNAGLLGNPHKTASNFKPGSLPTHTTLIVLLLGGDIELNPGPSVYPCGYCQHNVSWNGDGLCCDNCDMWFHPSCIDIS